MGAWSGERLLDEKHPWVVERERLNHWKIWRILKQFRAGRIEFRNGRIVEGEAYKRERNERLRRFAYSRRLAHSRLSAPPNLKPLQVEGKKHKLFREDSIIESPLDLLPLGPPGPPILLGAIKYALKQIAKQIHH